MVSLRRVSCVGAYVLYGVCFVIYSILNHVSMYALVCKVHKIRSLAHILL